MGERRRKPRSQYSATALVYQGNEQFTARIINVSASGVLLYPPVQAGRGTFLRLHMSLPALDEVLDLDGVVVREATYKGHYAWGVHFHEPPADATALLDTYVQWRKEKAAQTKARETLARNTAAVATAGSSSLKGDLDLSEGLPLDSQNSQSVPSTKPGLPAVGPGDEQAKPLTSKTASSGTHSAVGANGSTSVTLSGTHPSIRAKTTGPHQTTTTAAPPKTSSSESRADAEERWRRRSKATKADQELKDLYRAALHDVVGRPRRKRSKENEKKKGWFW